MLTSKKGLEKSTRQKALEFAKNNVPKPKAAKNNEELTIKDKTGLFKESPLKDEYTKLVGNHDLYADEVRKMKQEFASLFP